MTENNHQRQLIQWVKTQPWGQFLYHIPNETVGGRGWMVRNRQMGVRKGVPDAAHHQLQPEQVRGH